MTPAASAFDRRPLRAPIFAGLGAVVLSLGACAAPTAMTVAPAFADRTAPRPAVAVATPVKAATADAAPAATGCRIKVSGLSDARRAPETFGVVAGRAVKAPDDRDAWLRSVIAGLGPRGVTPEFGEAAGDPPPVAAAFTLQSAWVTNIRANKSANVVMHMRAERAGRPPVERDYRGALANINWASTPDELQHLVDAAVGKSLDQMAVDLAGLCAG